MDSERGKTTPGGEARCEDGARRGADATQPGSGDARYSSDAPCCSEEAGPTRGGDSGASCNCGAPSGKPKWIGRVVFSAVMLAAVGVGAHSLSQKPSPGAGGASPCSQACGSSSSACGGGSSSACLGGDSTCAPTDSIAAACKAVTDYTNR